MSAVRHNLACSRLSVVGREKGRAREKRRRTRFRSSPTTESLEQARHNLTHFEWKVSLLKTR